MVFCNLGNDKELFIKVLSHNPYFNRWFSAIEVEITIDTLEDFVTILILIDGFLQYHQDVIELYDNDGHNPYFNRWFSAIY